MIMRSEHIKEYVNQYFKTDISNKSRDREQFIYPRMVYYALCRKFCEPAESGNSVAKTLGLDHATRINGLKRFNDYFGQTFFKDYTEAFNVISEHIVANEVNLAKNPLKTIAEVENEYKERFLKLVEKQHRVINNMRRKCALYEKHKAIQEVFELPETDIREFEQLAKVFLKRKKRELEYSN